MALAGLGLPEFSRSRAPAAGSEGFGRARSCLRIFLWGGASRLDTWDPKPEAPAELRGSFASIATRIPGIRISEQVRRLAARTDKLGIVRSMSHDDLWHLATAFRVLTGHLAPTPYSDAAGPSPNDRPHLGALIARLRRRRGTRRALGVDADLPSPCRGRIAARRRACQRIGHSATEARREVGRPSS